MGGSQPAGGSGIGQAAYANLAGMGGQNLSPGMGSMSHLAQYAPLLEQLFGQTGGGTQGASALGQLGGAKGSSGGGGASLAGLL